MSRYTGPLLTRALASDMASAHAAGRSYWSGSLDLGRSCDTVGLSPAGLEWHGQVYPWPEGLKDRTIYLHEHGQYLPAARFGHALVKLVPSGWNAPTFEIDGIKMLPTAHTCPLEDARRKVALVEPRGACVLDTCGGLGYFAACALDGNARHILSFEKSPDVMWLRQINPWSPDPSTPETCGRLELRHDDILGAISTLPSAGFDAILHDPPRFGIAGELYSRAFYGELARVARPGARLFHYTGMPNRLTSGRNLPREVKNRLEKAGFHAETALDGVLATRAGSRLRRN